MAVSEIGRLEEIEGWTESAPRPFALRALKATTSFARRKPLGALCGVIVIGFMIIGDLVPETVNKFSGWAGLGAPVPYLADQLEKHTGFVYPYAKQNLRARFAGAS